MRRVHCHIAETRRQIDEALRLRYQVFAEELEYLDHAHTRVPREIDPFDTLETTIHFVAFVDDTPVGTARLMLPNDEVARNSGSSFGFDIESKFDLTPLLRANMQLAETMRYCVLQRARQTNVGSVLHAEGVRTSLHLGITHWIACANTETDSPEDARLIHSVGASRGLSHPSLTLAPLNPSAAPTESRYPFFSPEEKSLAGTTPTLMRYPRLLTMYVQRMGAKLVGPPLYDPRFRMYSIPILMTVAGQRVTHVLASPAIFSNPLAA